MQCLIMKVIALTLRATNGGAVMGKEALRAGDLLPEGGWGSRRPVVMLTVRGELPSRLAGVRRVIPMLIPLNVGRDHRFLLIEYKLKI